MGKYLVDYENVKTAGLAGVETLSENDYVDIFYSENADKISFELHQKINESKAQICFTKVDVGAKNALDFQLVSYLGYLIAQDSTQEFYIVSNDQGFGWMIKFWGKQNVKVARVPNLNKEAQKEEKDDTFDQVKTLIENEEDAKFVTDCIAKYKTKLGLNNALVKQYDSTKGGQLYKLIKPLIKDKKGK